MSFRRMGHAWGRNSVIGDTVAEKEAKLRGTTKSEVFDRWDDEFGVDGRRTFVDRYSGGRRVSSSSGSGSGSELVIPAFKIYIPLCFFVAGPWITADMYASGTEIEGGLVVVMWLVSSVFSMFIGLFFGIPFLMCMVVAWAYMCIRDGKIHPLR